MNVGWLDSSLSIMEQGVAEFDTLLLRLVDTHYTEGRTHKTVEKEDDILAVICAISVVIKQII